MRRKMKILLTTTTKRMCATNRKIPVQFCRTENVIGLFLDYYCCLWWWCCCCCCCFGIDLSVVEGCFFAYLSSSMIDGGWCRSGCCCCHCRCSYSRACYYLCSAQASGFACLWPKQQHWTSSFNTQILETLAMLVAAYHKALELIFVRPKDGWSK